MGGASVSQSVWAGGGRGWRCLCLSQVLELLPGPHIRRPGLLWVILLDGASLVQLLIRNQTLLPSTAPDTSQAPD